MMKNKLDAGIEPNEDEMSNEWTRSIEGIAAQLQALSVSYDYMDALKQMERDIGKRYETITAELEGEEFDVLDDFVQMKKKMNKVLNICNLVNSSVEKQIECVRMSFEKLSVMYGEDVDQLGEFFTDIDEFFQLFEKSETRFKRKAEKLGELIGNKRMRKNRRNSTIRKKVTLDKSKRGVVRKEVHLKKISTTPKPPKKRGREDSAYEFEDLPKKKKEPPDEEEDEEDSKGEASSSSETTEWETEEESEWETDYEIETPPPVVKKKKKKKEAPALPELNFSGIRDARDSESKRLTLKTHFFLIGEEQVEYCEVVELRKLTFQKNDQEVIYEIDIHNIEDGSENPEKSKSKEVKRMQVHLPKATEIQLRDELVKRIMATDTPDGDDEGEEEDDDDDNKEEEEEEDMEDEEEESSDGEEEEKEDEEDEESSEGDEEDSSDEEEEGETESESD